MLQEAKENGSAERERTNRRLQQHMQTTWRKG
jgi:hypothetical protein